MAKRQRRSPKSLPMNVANDPALWRFTSLQEALETNTDLLARLIRASEENEQEAGATDADTSEAVTVIRGA